MQVASYSGRLPRKLHLQLFYRGLIFIAALLKCRDGINVMSLNYNEESLHLDSKFIFKAQRKMLFLKLLKYFFYSKLSAK